jgi:FkbH-like protein
VLTTFADFPAVTTTGLNQRELFKAVAELRKLGQPGEARRVLGEALRRGRLDAQGVDKAGRLLKRELGEVTCADARVIILGQCTTSWLATSLAALAWGRGTTLKVVEGEYDNVAQELLIAHRDGEPRPNVVVLLPWTQRLFSDGQRRSAQQRVDEELAFWKQAWGHAAEGFSAGILQVGYDWMMPGAPGHHLAARAEGCVGQVRALNEALRSHLPAGSFFLDLEQIAGMMGRERFYDPRRYYWTKQPFSEAGLVYLAEHLWAGIRALTSGPKKVLVLDLDNTLWGGVVAETGPLGISLGESPDGEAYRAFQQHLKELSARGVVLAVCSKNNWEDARAPFDANPDMVLSLSDFAHFEASWASKAAGIKRIAEVLRLGLDSFVFFDDNPAERELIRQALPDVEVVEVPPEPAEYVRALQAGLWFETVTLAREDEERTLQYQQERQRRAAESSFVSLEDYLRSLEMVGEVRDVDDADLPRAMQLLAKTNQFNLTTRRHSREAVFHMLAPPGSLGLTLRVKDRFGDHGLIAVLLALPQAWASKNALRIDTWLMSCRMIGRSAEEFLFNALLRRARQAEIDLLIGEFISTPKNALVANLYDHLGFTRCAETLDGVVRYELAVSSGRPATTFVQAPA